MHELGVVFHIIKGVKKVAEENDLIKIASVTVELGQVSTVIPHYLTDCWKWACGKEDALRGAELKIEEIQAVTYCEACGKTYGTVEHGRTCPYCGSGKTYLIQGDQVMIKEIEAC